LRGPILASVVPVNPPKLLLDENLSPAIGLTLAGEGVDVVHVRDRGLLQATDRVVFERALQEDRILVTSDVDDFAKLAAAATVHAGLVFFEDGGP
jgi:predicted nuclease of predicted toxin-antitoxin system